MCSGGIGDIIDRGIDRRESGRNRGMPTRRGNGAQIVSQGRFAPFAALLLRVSAHKAPIAQPPPYCACAKGGAEKRRRIGA